MGHSSGGDPRRTISSPLETQRTILSRLEETVTLVVGVLSFNYSGRAARRQWIRRLSDPGSTSRILFALPSDQPDEDSEMDDVLHFQVAAIDRSVIGKYLLQNAWFCFATTLPDHVLWVARMDDDAIVSGTAIATRLTRLPMNLHLDHVVYGPFRNWYMWHPQSMQAVCWDYSPILWFNTWRASPPARAGTSAKAGPGSAKTFVHECMRPGVEGPYPFASGPFVAYSRRVAALLVGLLKEDEAYVLGERRQRPLTNVKTGYLANRTSRSHPSRRIFMEEIYYAYLLFREWRNATSSALGRGLVLVDEPMTEIHSKNGVYPAMSHITQHHYIFHKLRYASHFALLANSSILRTGREQRPPAMHCHALNARWTPAMKRAMRLQGLSDRWTKCDFRWIHGDFR
jgi:hypothetical protein